MLPRPPTPTLFPYTTLFRSLGSLRGVPSARTFVDLLAVHARVFVPVKGETPVVRSARGSVRNALVVDALGDRKSTRLNSSHVEISYAVFCLKKKNSTKNPGA